MIVDTSALVAYFNRKDPHHEAVANILGAANAALVVSPYVVAELDYLVATRLGTTAELQVLRELSSGAWDLAQFGVADIVAATAVIDAYSDQAVGIADASLVVLADRYRTRTIATLDHRHFSVLRPLRGAAPFHLVP